MNLNYLAYPLYPFLLKQLNYLTSLKKKSISLYKTNFIFVIIFKKRLSRSDNQFYASIFSSKPFLGQFDNKTARDTGTSLTIGYPVISPNFSAKSLIFLWVGS